MSTSNYIIFDFDGTVADTLGFGLQIYNRIAPGYKTPQIRQEDREMLRARKPQDILKEHNVSNLKVLALLLHIRRELSRHIRDMAPIQGMAEALHQIKNNGYRLGILTSNSRDNVNRFLKANQLDGLFDFVYSGKSFFGKDSVIRRLLDKEQIGKKQVIYVGDETRDIEACRKAGIPMIAVTWGLNSREVLLSLAPDGITDVPSEIPALIQQVFQK